MTYTVYFTASKGMIIMTTIVIMPMTLIMITRMMTIMMRSTIIMTMMILTLMMTMAVTMMKTMTIIIMKLYLRECSSIISAGLWELGLTVAQNEKKAAKTPKK